MWNIIIIIIIALKAMVQYGSILLEVMLIINITLQRLETKGALYAMF